MSENLKAFIGKNGGLVRLVAAFLFGLAIILFAGGFFAPGEDRSSEKEELSELFSEVFGVGECEVLISYGESGEVMAVAVICEGADSASVRKTLVDMIGALYGIGANRISVVKSR